MTAKEQRQMRKQEIRIEELENRLKRSNEIYANQLYEIVIDRTVMRQAYEALFDAMITLHRHMAQDPAFMHMRGEMAHDLEALRS